MWLLKIGLLIVLQFIFLKQKLKLFDFGENKYDLDVFS